MDSDGGGWYKARRAVIASGCLAAGQEIRAMKPDISRRDFMKNTAMAGAAAAMGVNVAARGAAAEQAKKLPAIRLGKLEVSRLILGSNPFYGFAHQPGNLAQEMKEYYTDERICQVLDAAANEGITAVASPPYPRWIRLFGRYLKNGGKLRIWIAQPDGPPQAMKAQITASVKGGARAVFVQGARAEEQFVRGNLDRLRQWVEHIRSLGVAAGLAAHRPDVHLAAEKAKFRTDFYFQCFFNPQYGYRKSDRDKAVAVLARINKPVVGYKILGAGRLKAEEAFGFAFRHLGSKDGVCVGMFPKHQPNQIAENADLTRKLRSTKAGGRGGGSR